MSMEPYGYREVLENVLKHTGGGHMITIGQATQFMGFVNHRAVYRHCPCFKNKRMLPVEIFAKELCACAAGRRC